MTASSTDDTLESPRPIAPPPLLALVCILLGAALDRALSLRPLPGEGTLPLGACCLLAAAAIFVSAVREFRRYETTVHPYKRASRLITTGPFAWSRNPLYVGLCLLQLGLGLVLGSLGVLLTMPILAALLTYGVIVREEKHLQAAFGEEYQRYSAAVRRWV